MSRFVLIDSSIKAAGGHHYEYACRVLDAAKTLGYETTLLAHRNFNKKRWRIDHRVASVFSLTYWDHYLHYYVQERPRRSLRHLLAPLGPAKKLWRSFRLLVRFSYAGLTYERARETRPGRILTSHFLIHDLSRLRSTRLGLAASVALRSLRGIALLLARSLRRMGRTAGRAMRPLLWLFALLAALPLAPLLLLRRAESPGERFTREFLQAPTIGKLGRGDIVFVPNATAAELEGLARLARSKAGGSRAHWAFLFRRPVFEGYPPDYQGQGESARLHRVQFAALKRAAPLIDASFHTDTDELTEQYNRLGSYAFSTLPVPVDLDMARRDKPRSELVLGYLGDARDEKGFHHLPDLVEALAQEGSAPRLRFLIQANFNTAMGDAKTRRAKRMLRHHPAVELVEGPFDRDQYRTLLQRMDVVLAPYDARQYAARSSGVLAEAIAAGAPIIVPAETAMAALAEPSRQLHLQELFFSDRAPSPVSSTSLSLLSSGEQTILVPDNATHLVVGMSFGRSPDRHIRLNVRFCNAAGAPLGSERLHASARERNVLFAVEIPRRTLSARIETQEPPETFRRATAVAHAFQLRAPAPLDAGIAIYSDPNEDFVPSVRSVVRFFEHHRRAAGRLREELLSFYSPVVLAERLRDCASKTPRGLHDAARAYV